MVLALSCAGAQSVVALPPDPAVVAGNAVFTRSPNELQIATATDHTILQWKELSVARHETINILQSSSEASVLLRVTGRTRAMISGTLKSNGRVLLVDSHGITIETRGRIEAAGFVASSHRVVHSAFLNDAEIRLDDSTEGVIHNRGAIIVTSADARGHVDLLGGKVLQEGIVSADGGGTVTLEGMQWVTLLPQSVVSARGSVGSSRVDLQACKLEYSIVSPK